MRDWRLPFQSMFEMRDFSLRDPALARLWGGGTSTSAGVAISEDSALNIAAFFQGVYLISAHIAAMPLIHYKRDQAGSKTRYVGSKLYKLLHDQPNPEMTAFSWRQALQAHILTWGNAYAEIERTKLDQPLALWPITPDRVTVYRDKIDLRIKYRIAPGNRIIDAADMLHIPGLGFDGLVGYSVIARARQSLGLMSAAERYGSTFFGNGSTFGGLLTTDVELEKEQREELRADIERLHRGPDRAHKFLVLYGGMKYERLAIPPNDAQFLTTRTFQIEEIARWLNIPPHKLKHLAQSTYSNIEQQNLDYLTDTLWPWLEPWEQEISRKLIPDLEWRQQFVEFKTEGILRADIKTRYEAYQIGHQGGWLSVDDIREAENKNPLPNGSGAIYLAPLNMVPADKYRDYIDNKMKPPALPPAPKSLADDGLKEKLDETKQQAAGAKASADQARDAVDALREELRVQVAAGATIEQLHEIEAQRDHQMAVALELQRLATEREREVERLAAAVASAEQEQRAAEARAIEALATSERDAAARVVAETLAAEAQAERDTAEDARVAAEVRTREALAISERESAARIVAEATVTTAAGQVTELMATVDATEAARQATVSAAAREREDLSRTLLDTRTTLRHITGEKVRLEETVHAARAAEQRATRERHELAQALAASGAAAAAAQVARAACDEQLRIAREDLTAALDARAKVEMALTAAEQTVAEVRADVAASTAATALVDAALADLRSRYDIDVAEVQDRRTAEADLVETRTALVAAQREASEQVDRLTAQQAGLQTALEEAQVARRLAEEARDAAAGQRDESAAAIVRAQTDAEAATARTRALADERVEYYGQRLMARREDLLSRIEPLIAMETERARKAVGSTAKFRTWMDTFYPGFEEHCVDKLKPAFGTLLADRGRYADRDRDTRIAVRAYLEESRRQLAGVLETSDEPDLLGAVTRLFETWRRDRASAFVDRLLAEDIDRVRSLERT